MPKRLNKTLAYYQSLGIPVLLMKDNPQQAGQIPKAALRFKSADPTGF